MKLLVLLTTLVFIHSGYGQDGDDGLTLECLPNIIRLTFLDRYLLAQDLDVIDGTQLHFNNNPRCYADRIQGGYALVIYQPFDGCGTMFERDTENYIYSNEVVYSRLGANVTTSGIIQFSCEYRDEYVVSAELPITPDVRTLNIVTSQGTLAVAMNLYQRSDYHPQSKFGPRPRIIVGVPVYVSVDVVDVFANEGIVTTLESCHATTNPNFNDKASRDSYHFLITGRCADDQTVRIDSNGIGTKARFSFQMFQWKTNSVEYVYLHCEVYICNRTEEVCVGSGPLCDSLSGEESAARRRKRDTTSQGSFGYISFGPISMKLDTGTPSFSKIQFTPLTEGTEKSQKLLLAYIFGSIAAVLVLVGIFLTALVVMKKRRKNQKKIKGISRNPPPTSSTNKEKDLPQFY